MVPPTLFQIQGQQSPRLNRLAETACAADKGLIIVAGTESFTGEVTRVRHFPDMGFMVSAPMP
jgi:hypothetical protein